MKYILSFFPLLFLSKWVLAAPVCDYHFQIDNATIMVSESEQVVQQDMTIWRGQNSPAGRCDIYRVYFGKGSANSYQRMAYNSNGDSVSYNLHPKINQSSVLKDINDAINNNERLEGKAPEKHTIYTRSFYISAPSISTQNFPAAGFYSDSVQITIYGYNQNSGNYNFEETKPFTISFLIPQRLFVSLIDEGGVFDRNATSKVLDFGNLTQPQTKGADLRVVSNTPYEVMVSSMNNGRLKHAKGEVIPYIFQVNGGNVSLTNSANVPVKIGEGGLTTTAGTLYNLKIQASASVEDKISGLYQDSITITAIAN